METVDLFEPVRQLVGMNAPWVVCNVSRRVIFDFVGVRLKQVVLLNSKNWFSFPPPGFPCSLTSISTIMEGVYE